DGVILDRLDEDPEGLVRQVQARRGSHDRRGTHGAAGGNRLARARRPAATSGPGGPSRAASCTACSRRLMLEALGVFIHRHPRRILIGTGLFLAVSLGVVLSGGRLTGGVIEGLEAGLAEQRLARVRGVSTDTTVIAVFSLPELAA